MADFFDTDDSRETLTHRDVNDAVEYKLDGLDPDNWTSEITVYAFTRKVVAERDKRASALSAIESLIEDLNEDFGGPDGFEATDSMIVAAEAFVNSVVSEYEVWQCECTPEEDVTVRTAVWVREHHPEWLKQDDVVEAIEQFELYSSPNRAAAEVQREMHTQLVERERRKLWEGNSSPEGEPHG